MLSISRPFAFWNAAHGISGPQSETSTIVGPDGEPKGCEPVLNIGDRLSGVPLSVETHHREDIGSKRSDSVVRQSSGCQETNSESSLRRRCLGIAPMIRFFSTPSLKRIRVGMLMTSFVAAGIGL